jgi:dipeptidyl-peptidase-3
LVAIVNKKRTENLTKLVNKGPEILKHMPWDKSLEKNHFLAPDATSLDMIEWHGEGQPTGINIPNYYDIKDNEGFKNLVIEDNEKKNDKKKWKQVPNMKSEEDSMILNAVSAISKKL